MFSIVPTLDQLKDIIVVLGSLIIICTDSNYLLVCWYHLFLETYKIRVFDTLMRAQPELNKNLQHNMLLI